MAGVKGQLRTCNRGHKFLKTSDCPICPDCWPGRYRKKIIIRGSLWKYPGKGGWYFVDLSARASKTVQSYKDATIVGWGYVKVRATVGETSWDTTLFPAKDGRYLLAIKANVRKKEGIAVGDVIRAECTFL